MRIPGYWTKGRVEDAGGVFEAWGWSYESLAEARTHAAERARGVLARWREGTIRDSYDYIDVPLREEIIETFWESDDAVAIVTRNRYGALVLNAARVCFVDVDFPRVEGRGLFDEIGLMWSKRKREARKKENAQATIARIRNWAAANPTRPFRMYRTAAGLRLLFTDRLYDPASAETVALLDELGSDKLYRRLTERQECFRARVTPKPWRIGSERPPNRYPRETDEAEQKFTRWLQDYEAKSAGYGNCTLEEQFGAYPEDAEIVRVLTAHDAVALGGGETLA